uniref:Uncharacterized protein n=1 Tax=Glossina austeni TaxID=7395 RepID=A0A1A9VF67_GLOAU
MHDNNFHVAIVLMMTVMMLSLLLLIQHYHSLIIKKKRKLGNKVTNKSTETKSAYKQAGENLNSHAIVLNDAFSCTSTRQRSKLSFLRQKSVKENAATRENQYKYNEPKAKSPNMMPQGPSSLSKSSSKSIGKPDEALALQWSRVYVGAVSGVALCDYAISKTSEKSDFIEDPFVFLDIRTGTSSPSAVVKNFDGHLDMVFVCSSSRNFLKNSCWCKESFDLVDWRFSTNSVSSHAPIYFFLFFERSKLVLIPHASAT